MPTESITRQATVPESAFGQRLDVVLADLFNEFSRVRLQEWIKEGRVSVDGVVAPRARDKLKGGESLMLNAEIEHDSGDQPEDIPIEIVYEDDQLLIVYKPVGLVTHPAPGNRTGTLVNALLFRAPDLALLPRAGIVHRLDKDTSGLLVVARRPESHLFLTRQLAKRKFLREYDALVHGVVITGGKVEAAIARDPINRECMAVVEELGREATTHYRVVERFRNFSHIKLRLETGRTHQIRVHMTHIGFPLLGDPVYGGRIRMPAQAAPEFLAGIKAFKRQALHATRLGLTHPNGEWMEWQTPLPGDMAQMVDLLRNDRAANEA